MNTRTSGQAGLMIVILLGSFLIAGCGGKGDTESKKTEAAELENTEEVEAVDEAIVALTEAEMAMVQQVAAITTAVEKAPATADATLAQFGMTAEEYEAAVYKIAESPSLSEAYQRAMGH